MAFIPCPKSSLARLRNRARWGSSSPNALTTRIPARNSINRPACRVEAWATRRPASRAFLPSFPIGIAQSGRNTTTNSVSGQFNATSRPRMLRTVNGSFTRSESRLPSALCNTAASAFTRVIRSPDRARVK
jgi:hypothetical protein